MESKQILTILDSLFDNERNRFPGWHGYGIGHERAFGNVTLLFIPGSNPQSLITTLEDRLAQLKMLDDRQVQFETLFVPRFQQMRTGRNKAFPNALRPGNMVFAEMKRGRRGPVGTIGAFLRLASKSDHRRWLLSCNHILLPRNPLANSVVGKESPIRGHAGVIIGSSVITIGPHRKLFDAALVQVINSKSIDPTYNSQLGLNSVVPITKLARGMVAKKQGNATGITNGLIVHDAVRVVVQSLTGQDKIYDDSILVGSIMRDRPFVARGDSGSLLVVEGQPAGIIHGKTNRAPDESVPLLNTKGPFALAVPFGAALKELSEQIAADHTLEMVPFNCRCR